MERWAGVAEALEELPERERRILDLRFFVGLTQREIGDRLCISQMHVSRLLALTLEEIRARSAPPELPDPA